jgi:manganese/zinc/iron transport system ATP- binding protein
MKKLNREQALFVDGLTVHYDGVPALWDISLDVPRGKFVGILGPNGAGKSTFMKALLGLEKKVSGTLLFSGKKLDQMKGKIAYIPQKETIDFNFPMTVKELVLMGRYPKLGLFKRVQKQDIEAACSMLERVGLQEFQKRQIGELSGGQQQRLFLARALLQDAEYYFLDEALSGVDHASEEIIITILKEMQQKGKTIFMVHHDLNTVESYFDWLLFLNIRLIASGELKNVFTPRIMQETYGKSFQIYSEAFKRKYEISEQ